VQPLRFDVQLSATALPPQHLGKATALKTPYTFAVGAAMVVTLAPTRMNKPYCLPLPILESVAGASSYPNVLWPMALSVNSVGFIVGTLIRPQPAAITL